MNLKPATILHLDVDAFAASVERARDPALRGRAVVIGCDAGGRGLVACASHEARRLGVHAGMSLSAARRRAGDAVFLAGDPALLRRESARLFSLVHAAAPVVEAASLDDFYLDLTGCERLFGGSLVRWAVLLARDLRDATGLPLSMGLAENKMVARVATRLAKPGGMIEVMPGCSEEFLAPVSLRLLPGVGEAARLRLRDCGVRQCGQLAALGEPVLRLMFGGTAGSALWRRARGEHHEAVKPSALHRFLVHEHRFTGDTADPRQLEAAAAFLAQRLAADLRARGLRTATAELTITYCDSREAAHGVRLGYASDQDLDFVGPVRGALAAAFSRRVRVRSLRLRCPVAAHPDGQYDLFAEGEISRRRGLYRALDAVRTRHGFGSLLVARSVDR